VGYLRGVEVEERAKVVELIETLIAADGVVADEEREFLRRVVGRFGLTEQVRADRVVPSDAGRAMATLRGLAPDVQARVMALLVEAAVVDGRVEPEERALLLASAATLGIEAYALEERIARRLKSQVPAL
jgi:tellurite resistance protein